MLYEEGNTRTWGAFGVVSQHNWVLLDQNGEILISRQQGSVDENRVLDAIS